MSIKQALGNISGGRVLDVATGKGNFIKTLVENLKSYTEIIGIDTFDYITSLGSIFDAENIRFIQTNGTRLGLADESFDTVSISSSLHHLENVPGCVAEMQRVLKPGGRLIVRETHRDVQTEPQLVDLHIHHWVAEIDAALGFTHNKPFARQELVDLVSDLGLRTVAFYDVLHTDSSPMDKAALRESKETIENYIRRAKELAGYRTFKQQGQELLQRLYEIGIHWEPEFVAVGEKR